MSPRVLAVEDVPHNLELMTYLLEAGGFVVDQATTGAAALQRIRERRADLVLLDVHLPDADGFEILALLRADPELVDVPVVAVTAHAMVGDREDALSAGFDGYLTKPIDPHTFADVVRRYLPATRRPVSDRPGVQAQERL